MQVIRKGSIRNRQLNRQSILEHNHSVRGTEFSMQCLQASLSMRGRLVSQTTEYADTTTQHEQAAAQRCSDYSTKGQTIHGTSRSQCASQRAPATQSEQQYLGRHARVSHSKSPTECTVHVVLSVLCNAVVVREATHACVSVVGVHRSVTTSRIIDPQPNFSRKLLCVRLSESVDESPSASSTTQLITPLST